MQLAADTPRARVRRRVAVGDALIPGGIALTLVGVIGDLIGRTLDASATQSAPLIVFSLHGNSPWHLLLLAGILATSVGGIRWAMRLESELGGLLSAAMVLLLGMTLVLGAWSGVRSASEVAASGGLPVEQRCAHLGKDTLERWRHRHPFRVFTFTELHKRAAQTSGRRF